MTSKRSALGIPDPKRWFWTEEQIALLGMATDEEVAARIGKTSRAVCDKRCRLGIPAYCDRQKVRE